MLIDLAAWVLGVYLILSGCIVGRLSSSMPAVLQSVAWTQGSIAAGAALIGLAIRHPESSHWHTLGIATAAFFAAAAFVSGLLKVIPGTAAVSRQYTNTLPALAACVAILTCLLLAMFAPANVEGAALGLLAVFAAVAARLSLIIAWRNLHHAGLSACATYGVLVVAFTWFGIALLSPADSRVQMGLLAGALLAVSVAGALGQRLLGHLDVVTSEDLTTRLPGRQQIDRFLSDYFRHKQPEGVILLKFAIADPVDPEAGRDASGMDQLFQDVGSVLQQNFRVDDFVAGVAGRHFLVACPGLQPDIAQALAERACQAVKRAEFHDHRGEPADVTLLVGFSNICETLPECEQGWQQADGELSGPPPVAA